MRRVIPLIGLILLMACSNQIELVRPANAPTPNTTISTPVTPPSLLSTPPLTPPLPLPLETPTSTEPLLIPSSSPFDSFHVTETWPSNLSRDIELNRAIEIYLNKDADEATITNEQVQLSLPHPLQVYDVDPIRYVLIDFDPSKRLLIIDSNAGKLAGETIQVTLSPNIQSRYHEPLQPYSFQFTLKAPEPQEPFQVISSWPSDKDTFRIVDAEHPIEIIFNQDMDKATLNRQTILVESLHTPIPVSIETIPEQQKIRLILPTKTSFAGQTITVQLTEAIKNSFGKSLTPYTFQFSVKP